MKRNVRHSVTFLSRKYNSQHYVELARTLLTSHWKPYSSHHYDESNRLQLLRVIQQVTWGRVLLRVALWWKTLCSSMFLPICKVFVVLKTIYSGATLYCFSQSGTSSNPDREKGLSLWDSDFEVNAVAPWWRSWRPTWQQNRATPPQRALRSPCRDQAARLTVFDFRRCVFASNGREVRKLVVGPMLLTMATNPYSSSRSFLIKCRCLENHFKKEEQIPSTWSICGGPGGCRLHRSRCCTRDVRRWSYIFNIFARLRR